jgi:hypothetical protein
MDALGVLDLNKIKPKVLLGDKEYEIYPPVYSVKGRVVKLLSEIGELNKANIKLLGKDFKEGEEMSASEIVKINIKSGSKEFLENELKVRRLQLQILQEILIIEKEEFKKDFTLDNLRADFYETALMAFFIRFGTSMK